MAIPHVFHQIWINQSGPALPARYHAWRDSWLRHHPDWDYRLWSLDNLDFTPTHRALIDSAPSYAQKADILRYEILLRHGGIYIDVDFECLKPLTPLVHQVQNFGVSENGRVVSVGIIGAATGSAYMERCVALMPSRVGMQPPNVETGPTFFTACLLSGGLDGDFSLFPSAWFYPYAMNEPERAGGPFPDAYAVHHWAASWATRPAWPVRALRRLRRMTLTGH